VIETCCKNKHYGHYRCADGSLLFHHTHPLGAAVANTRTIYYPLRAGTRLVYPRGLELERTSLKINLCTDTPPLATQWVIILAAIILVPVTIMVLLTEALYSFNWDLEFSSLRCRSEGAWKWVRGTKEQSGKHTHVKFGSKTRVMGWHFAGDGLFFYLNMKINRRRTRGVIRLCITPKTRNIDKGNYQDKCGNIERM